MAKIEVKKKNVDISKVSIPVVRTTMKLEEFKKWCTTHGFTGDIEKKHKELQKK